MTEKALMTITTPSDVEVVMQRRFNAPRSAVFEAWTRPDYMVRWMTDSTPMTMPTCEVDLKVGGIWRFIVRGQDGSEVEMRSTYREIVRPEIISWDETWSGPEPGSINTILLEEDGAGTLMTFSKIFKSREERDAGIAAGIADFAAAADALARVDIMLVEIEAALAS